MDDIGIDADAGALRRRRSLLIGALGGALASFVTARMPAARAGEDAPVLLGRRNEASAPTSIATTRRGGTAVEARAPGAGAVAIEARADRGTGVHGVSTSGNGVSGETVFGTAVSALSVEAGSYAVSGNSANGVGVQGGSEGGVGVQGNARDGVAVQGANVSDVSPAVQGWAQGGQTGVMGSSTTLDAPNEVASPRNVGVFGVADGADGRGVLARSRDGIALETKGRVRFTTAGTTSIAAGASAASTTPRFVVTDATKVVAMPQSDPGSGVSVRWVEVDAAANAITFHLSSAAATDSVIAWFAFE